MRFALPHHLVGFLVITHSVDVEIDQMTLGRQARRLWYNALASKIVVTLLHATRRPGSQTVLNLQLSPAINLIAGGITDSIYHLTAQRWLPGHCLYCQLKLLSKFNCLVVIRKGTFGPCISIVEGKGPGDH